MSSPSDYRSSLASASLSTCKHAVLNSIAKRCPGFSISFLGRLKFLISVPVFTLHCAAMGVAIYCASVLHVLIVIGNIEAINTTDTDIDFSGRVT